MQPHDSTARGSTSALEQIIALLASHRADLVARYRLSELGVFGSYVRGEQRPNSDVDILVAFDSPPSLFTVIALEDELRALLGRPVDVAVKSALRPHIGARILREVVNV